LWPNGWLDHDVTWYGGRPQPKRNCIRLGPSSPSPKRGRIRHNFRPMSIVAKRSPISATAEHLLYSLPFYPAPRILCFTMLFNSLDSFRCACSRVRIYTRVIHVPWTGPTRHSVPNCISICVVVFLNRSQQRVPELCYVH